MPKKNQQPPSVKPGNKAPVIPSEEMGEQAVPEITDPDIIPADDEFTTPPYEAPEPGEGP